jgi:hypothetical protein
VTPGELSAVVAVVQFAGAMIFVPAGMWWLDKRYASREDVNRIGEKVSAVTEELAVVRALAQQAADENRHHDRQLQEHREYIDRHIADPIRDLTTSVGTMGQAIAVMEARAENSEKLLGEIREWVMDDLRLPKGRDVNLRGSGG